MSDPRGTAVVVTVSTRAAAGVYSDRTGPLIAEWCADRGFVVESVLVPDGPELATTLADAASAHPAVIITTGGTGIAPSDVTPEATRAVVERELPGFGEELRRRGAGIPGALLSRAIAGVVGHTLVVNLPGSTGGVSDGLDLLDLILDHTLDQLRGGDHAANA